MAREKIRQCWKPGHVEGYNETQKPGFLKIQESDKYWQASPPIWYYTVKHLLKTCQTKARSDKGLFWNVEELFFTQQKIMSALLSTLYSPSCEICVTPVRALVKTFMKLLWKPYEPLKSPCNCTLLPTRYKAPASLYIYLVVYLPIYASIYPFVCLLSV